MNDPNVRDTASRGSGSSEPDSRELSPTGPDPMLEGDVPPATQGGASSGDSEAAPWAVDVAASPAGPVAPAGRKRVAWNVLAHVQFALLALTIALFIITFVIQAFRIPSGSMENTLLIGDYLLVDKTRFAPSGGWHPVLPYRGIRREDIIVFRYPVDPAQHFVKRVIGLPGDRIHLWHSQVYVNGRILREPYVVFKEHFPDEFRDNFPRGNRINQNISVDWGTQLHTMVDHGDLIVPRGQYFVLGDNRDQSLDSRYWGFVPRENIIGRPMVIYFSMVEAPDDDDPIESSAADDKLFSLRARISHGLGDLRWRRILRLAP